jgi:TonB family protein
MGVGGLTVGGSMTLGPTSRQDQSKKTLYPGNGTSKAAADSFASDPVEEIVDLARTLANVGGGALSLDLALDLVLNETVEQAREATRATGAAIALTRDGGMICRATTGNAPNLGTPVDTSSGLSAACLKTGTIQQCSDTERDPRVDAEACRHLDVRSMLLLPISDATGVYGILEVFSPIPNNFGDQDLQALQLLATRINSAKIATEESFAEKASSHNGSAAADQSHAAVAEGKPSSEKGVPPQPGRELAGPERGTRNEVLTSVLVVLVIAAAVLLGIVIGVRQTYKRTAQSTGSSAAVKDSHAMQAAQGVSSAVPPAQASPAAITGVPARNRAVPAVGGLIVTQNGKVIYRAESTAASAKTPADDKSAAQLLHRVDPQYPEAAKTQHLEGAVVLEAHVLGDGTVGNVAIVNGDPLLAEAATQAVKQWKYQPYVVDGRPVERQERITVKFSLPSS